MMMKRLPHLGSLKLYHALVERLMWSFKKFFSLLQKNTHNYYISFLQHNVAINYQIINKKKSSLKLCNWMENRGEIFTPDVGVVVSKSFMKSNELIEILLNSLSLSSIASQKSRHKNIKSHASRTGPWD